MPKPKSISGFPEWLPAQKLAEQYFLDVIRSSYELYGFTPLETPAVERVEALAAKGVIDKEIYALGRLREAPEERDKWELALHFDLTVPLARYVALHFGELHFPFKRYQIQKVWRGERPQEGRFREFYQADIDVIAEDKLPLAFDAEIPLIIHSIFERMKIQSQIRLNNRKVLLGYYAGLNLSPESSAEVLREVDKLEKIGPDKVREQLAQLGLEKKTINACLTLAEIRGRADQVVSALEALPVKSEELEVGLEEVRQVSPLLNHLPDQTLIWDLGIVRGLDYYTGTIYETNLPAYPSLGSICSGGRYENLASEFINRKLPGVGISIGVSRLVSYLFSSGDWAPPRCCPTQVLIVLPSSQQAELCAQLARQLREAGVATEVHHLPQAMKKQLRYADRRGIPQVLFPHQYSPDEGLVEIKTLATGEQITVNLVEWLGGQGDPPPRDRSGLFS